MKKSLATLLSVIMALSVIVVACRAAEDSDEWKNNTGVINLTDMTVSGSGVSVSENTITINEGGDFDVTGTLADGMIYVNTEDKVKLRLSGADISNSTGPAIFFDNVEKGFITITEDTENYLSDGKEYTEEEADAALFSNDDLEIKGNGVLNISGNYKHGIAGDDDIVIENGVINITSYEHGIKANDTLNITGGEITINAQTGKGMKAGLELVIDDGILNITTEESEGLESKGILTINGGDINITSAEDGINTGNESTVAETAAGESKADATQDAQQPNNMRNDAERPEMPPNEERQAGMRGPGGRGFGGQRQNREMPPMTDGSGIQMPEVGVGEMPRGGMAQGGGFGRIDEETAAAHAITINGGKIYINALGDGIDSNGNLTINGGEIIIDGPVNNGNGSLDSEGTMEINGGIVIAASSAGMMQLPRGTDGQNILRAVFDEKKGTGTVISIRNDEGEEIMSHTPQNEYQALIFSSELLKGNSEYTLYTDGEEYESFTATEGQTTIGNAAGGMGGFRDVGQARGDRGQMREKRIRVNIDGNAVIFDTEPTIKNDTTLVGFRAILEALGAVVEWDEETRTVTAVKDNITITLTVNSDIASVNGKECTLAAAPEIINNSTMIPIRFISEQLGMNVKWDDVTRQIDVTSK
ncbi:MAG: carbohydrate-binding domain-containing protein [Clostridia bacterium]|nr:carbohydrate-binding domain-containing protein [Clostridia bacterium]